jgi:hypothetical protein
VVDGVFRLDWQQTQPAELPGISPGPGQTVAFVYSKRLGRFCPWGSLALVRRSVAPAEGDLVLFRRVGGTADVALVIDDGITKRLQMYAPDETVAARDFSIAEVAVIEAMVFPALLAGRPQQAAPVRSRCQLCGELVDSLPDHVQEAHGITPARYKQLFEGGGGHADDGEQHGGRAA